MDTGAIAASRLGKDQVFGRMVNIVLDSHCVKVLANSLFRPGNSRSVCDGHAQFRVVGGYRFVSSREAIVKGGGINWKDRVGTRIAGGAGGVVELRNAVGGQ